MIPAQPDQPATLGAAWRRAAIVLAILVVGAFLIGRGSAHDSTKGASAARASERRCAAHVTPFEGVVTDSPATRTIMVSKLLEHYVEPFEACVATSSRA
jgi:hypothetical protein